MKSGLARHVLRDELAEDRARDHRGGQADEQAVEDGLTDVGAEHADGQERSRVRRHQAVHHREARQQRNADADQRHAGAPRHDEHQRNEQHEADLEEEGNAHQEGREHHGPVHAFLAERVDQRARDTVGAARLRHHLAEHGAQAEHDAHESEHAAEAVLEGLHHQVHRHAGGQAEEARGQRQRDEGVHAPARDQKDQAEDRHQGVDEQENLFAHSEHSEHVLSPESGHCEGAGGGTKAGIALSRTIQKNQRWHFRVSPVGKGWDSAILGQRCPIQSW
jgi:hypothetical protein